MPLASTEPIELPAELVALLEPREARPRRERRLLRSDGPAARARVGLRRRRARGADRRRPSTRRARSSASTSSSCSTRRTYAKTSPSSRSTWRASAKATRPAGSRTLLEQHGSTAYLAEIGGEVVARGTKPDGSAWRIGVENPVAGAPAGPALRMPPAARTAVITSGSYRHYLEVDGRRFGHIIDPRSGWPVEHALLSVTVVGHDAATAAAWGTALLCLGPDDAAATAERENLAALLWVSRDGEAAALELSRAFSSDGRVCSTSPAAARASLGA